MTYLQTFLEFNFVVYPNPQNRIQESRLLTKYCKLMLFLTFERPCQRGGGHGGLMDPLDIFPILFRTFLTLPTNF